MTVWVTKTKAVPWFSISESHTLSQKFLFCKTPYINSPCRVYIMVYCQKEEKKTVLHSNLFFFFGILNVNDHKNFWLLFIIDLHCWVGYCFDFSSLRVLGQWEFFSPPNWPYFEISLVDIKYFDFLKKKKCSFNFNRSS